MAAMERKPRAGRKTDIAEAILRITGREGVHSLTMERLGRELGVTARGAVPALPLAGGDARPGRRARGRAAGGDDPGSGAAAPRAACASSSSRARGWRPSTSVLFSSSTPSSSARRCRPGGRAQCGRSCCARGLSSRRRSARRRRRATSAATSRPRIWPSPSSGPSSRGRCSPPSTATGRAHPLPTRCGPIS